MVWPSAGTHKQTGCNCMKSFQKRKAFSVLSWLLIKQLGTWRCGSKFRDLRAVIQAPKFQLSLVRSPLLLTQLLSIKTVSWPFQSAPEVNVDFTQVLSFPWSTFREQCAWKKREHTNTFTSTLIPNYATAGWEGPTPRRNVLELLKWSFINKAWDVILVRWCAGRSVSLRFISLVSLKSKTFFIYYCLSILSKRNHHETSFVLLSLISHGMVRASDVVAREYASTLSRSKATGLSAEAESLSTL